VKGVYSEIIQSPNNTLVVRCVDSGANMTCMSNDTTDTGPGDNTIAWTYDGNTVINSPCDAFTNVFAAINGDSNQHCGIEGDLLEARNSPIIRSISGPYGCTDRESRGVTETSMVVVLGKVANEYSKSKMWKSNGIDSVLTDMHYHIVGIRVTYKIRNISKCLLQILSKLTGFQPLLFWPGMRKIRIGHRRKFWARDGEEKSSTHCIPQFWRLKFVVF